MVFHNVVRGRALDQTAFPTPHELHARHLDDVLRYVTSFVRPLADAEDVTMEVFHAAFQNIHRLRQADDPKVWLLGIARRKVADALRRRYRRQETPIEEWENLSDELRQRIETSTLVKEVLAQLPQDQREALVLKYCSGLSTQEIAIVLNRTEAAANSLLQRARDAFYTLGAPMFLDDPEVDHV